MLSISKDLKALRVTPSCLFPLRMFGEVQRIVGEDAGHAEKLRGLIAEQASRLREVWGGL